MSKNISLWRTGINCFKTTFQRGTEIIDYGGASAVDLAKAGKLCSGNFLMQTAVDCVRDAKELEDSLSAEEKQAVVDLLASLNR